MCTRCIHEVGTLLPWWFIPAVDSWVVIPAVDPWVVIPPPAHGGLSLFLPMVGFPLPDVQAVFVDHGSTVHILPSVATLHVPGPCFPHNVHNGENWARTNTTGNNVKRCKTAQTLG